MQLRRPPNRWPLLAALCLAASASVTTARAAGPPSPADRPSLAGGIDWINTDRPIHLDKLRGKVVLLDFWTFCCINCHHIIPTLAKLEAKYKDQLVVVGVHTAKFDAERVTANIRKKVREYDVRHPVVNDANQVIWNNFRVESWPTLILIDPDGDVYKRGSGEISFEILDEHVGALVRDYKAKGKLDETPVQFFPEREKAHAGGLLFPGKVAADERGDRLFIADTGHNRVVITDLKGKFRDAIGGGPEGLADGPFDRARLSRPQGVCLVGDTLFVADTENHAIRAVDLKSRTVTTVAGNGRQAEFGVRGGRGKEISLSSPWDLVLIPGTRTLAVAMAGPHQIWTYQIDTSEALVAAGTGREDIIDGPPAESAFAQPSGLATDGKHLFVADSEGSAVREIGLPMPDHAVATIAGTHDLARGASLFAFGDRDGGGSASRLQHCLGLAFGAGKLFIADSYNNKVKALDLGTREVRTLAGTTRAGATDSPPLFDEPGGLSYAAGNLYVADTNNHQVRVIGLADGKVRTLALDGVQPPRVRRVPTFPNATVVDARPVDVGPARDLTLSFKLSLPAGYELNEEAPMTYLVEVPEAPSSLSDRNPATGGRLEKPSTGFEIPVAFAAEGKPGQVLNIRVSVGALVCLPNTLCTAKNFVWNVPVRITAGAPSKATIAAP